MILQHLNKPHISAYSKVLKVTLKEFSKISLKSIIINNTKLFNNILLTAKLNYET